MDSNQLRLQVLACIATILIGLAAVPAAAQCTRCGPGLLVSPTTLTFPPQVVHTKSAALTITLRSVGVFPVQFQGIVGGTPFAQTNNCHSLPRNASCHIQVTFTPRSVGTFTGKITIKDNAGTQVVPLSGIGIAP